MAKRSGNKSGLPGNLAAYRVAHSYFTEGDEWRLSHSRLMKLSDAESEARRFNRETPMPRGREACVVLDEKVVEQFKNRQGK